MRATAFVLLLALALATIFNAECVKQGKAVDCSDFENLPPGEGRACIQVYDPICGSDGKTYGNRCSFCEAVVKSNNKLKFAHVGEC